MLKILAFAILLFFPNNLQSGTPPIGSKFLAQRTQERQIASAIRLAQRPSPLIYVRPPASRVRPVASRVRYGRYR